jgi:hypothetical protein
VRIAEDRTRSPTGRVEALTQIEVGGVVATLMDLSLPARPAEVLNGRIGGIDYPVDLLRVVPAHITDP